ncbi:MAG: hypothetical protein ACLQKA_05790 [Bryobacteraceae bacterium]
MKTRLLALLLLAGASAFAAPRVFVGVGFGYHPVYPYRAYVPAPVVAYAAPVPVAPAYYAPAMPGPGYVWIAGWGGRAGYWARPPYVGASWVGPRYFGGRYYAGHWRR